MTHPMSLEFIKRLSTWPELQKSVMKNSLALLEGAAEQTNSEDTNEDLDDMEENPALEGHFLTERSPDVSALDSCICKCHRAQTTLRKLSLPFNCSKCNQQFCCKCQFEVHRESHRGQRKHQCATCGKTYNYKSDLGRHELVHAQVKPHVCKVCNRSFNQVGHLITHRLTHTGEKPFTCEVCNRSFSRKSNLHKHMSVHTGERPFQCTICDSKFSRKGDLQRHSMLHTGERPYKCDFCDKTFSQKPHLTSHSAVHTGERPYKCLACGRSFIRKNLLLKHQEEDCADFATTSDFTTLSSNSFFNLNHLLAGDDETESTVEKSFFNVSVSEKCKSVKSDRKMSRSRLIKNKNLAHSEVDAENSKSETESEVKVESIESMEQDEDSSEINEKDETKLPIKVFKKSVDV